MLEKRFPDRYLKNEIWAYLWINIVKFYNSLFLLYANLKGTET